MESYILYGLLAENDDYGVSDLKHLKKRIKLLDVEVANCYVFKYEVSALNILEAIGMASILNSGVYENDEEIYKLADVNTKYKGSQDGRFSKNFEEFYKKLEVL